MIITIILAVLLFSFLSRLGASNNRELVKFGKAAYDGFDEKLVPTILIFIAIASLLGYMMYSAWTAPDGDLPYDRNAPSSTSR